MDPPMEHPEHFKLSVQIPTQSAFLQTILQADRMAEPEMKRFDRALAETRARSRDIVIGQ